MPKIISFGTEYPTYDAAVAALNAEIKRLCDLCLEERKKTLLSLPGEYGLATVDELIAALADVASPAMRSRVTAPKPTKAGTPRKEPSYTLADEARSQIADLIRNGKTNKEIASFTKLPGYVVRKVRWQLKQGVSIAPPKTPLTKLMSQAG